MVSKISGRLEMRLVYSQDWWEFGPHNTVGFYVAFLVVMEKVEV